MEYLFTAAFLILWICCVVALSFSVVLSYRTGNRSWKFYSLFYVYLNIKIFFHLIQIYLKSNFPLENISQIYWFGIHSDVSLLLCLSFSIVFQTLLDIPNRKMLNRIFSLFLIFIALLTMNPYLVRLIYGPDSYFFFVPYLDNILLLLSFVYNCAIFFFYYGNIKLPEQKRSAVSLAVLFLYFFIDHFFIIMRLFFNPLNIIMSWFNILFYIIWNIVFLLFLIRGFIRKPDNLMDINLEPAFIKSYNLTERESEIVNMLIQGKTNPSISEKLFLSIKTVKNHIYKIYQKTGVKSRIELAYLIKNRK